MTGENDLFLINDGETCPHEQELGQVVSATFEKMGFMEAFGCDARDESTDMLCATLFIKEPVQAKMYFGCPQELAWKIAENLYGLEELSTDVVADMMTELLNTIAGSWLSNVIPDQPFTLSIPDLCTDMSHAEEEKYEYHFRIDNIGVVSVGLKQL